MFIVLIVDRLYLPPMRVYRLRLCCAYACRHTMCFIFIKLLHSGAPVCVCVKVSACVCVCMCVNVCACVCVSVHTHMHTHTHIVSRQIIDAKLYCCLYYQKRNHSIHMPRLVKTF